MMAGHGEITSVWGTPINVRKAHRDFLSEYGLTAEHVPLLEFTPDNWDEPFSMAKEASG